MRILLISLAVLVVAVIGAAVFFRSAAMPADRWHVDPSTAEPPGTPNYVLLAGADAPQFSEPPAQIAARLAEVAAAEGAVLIGGDLTDGFATYVQRTRLMGYPDAISLKLTATETGTRVEVFSRSRFGASDFGVNAARVTRWLAALGPAVDPEAP